MCEKCSIPQCVVADRRRSRRSHKSPFCRDFWNATNIKFRVICLRASFSEILLFRVYSVRKKKTERQSWEWPDDPLKSRSKYGSQCLRGKNSRARVGRTPRQMFSKTTAGCRSTSNYNRRLWREFRQHGCFSRKHADDHWRGGFFSTEVCPPMPRQERTGLRSMTKSKVIVCVYDGSA